MVEKTRHRKFPETVSWPETVGCKGVNLCISYDAQNRRVYRKADEDQSGSQETELYYVLDGNRVIEERVYSDEDLKRDYWYGVYIDEPVFARADLNDDNDFSDTGEQFYYLHNTQYSVHAIVDTSGSIIEVYKNYQPYGAVTVYTGDGGDGDWWDGDETTGSLSGNYYLFTGRRLDPEADLMFYRNRMYSTSRGRFLQRDPIGYVDGLNLYRAYFVPGGVDPSGKGPVLTGALLAVVVAALTTVSIRIAGNVSREGARQIIRRRIKANCDSKKRTGKFSTSYGRVNVGNIVSDVIKSSITLGIFPPDIEVHSKNNTYCKYMVSCTNSNATISWVVYVEVTLTAGDTSVTKIRNLDDESFEDKCSVCCP